MSICMLSNFTNDMRIYLDHGHQLSLAGTQLSTQVIILYLISALVYVSIAVWIGWQRGCKGTLTDIILSSLEYV